MSKLHIRWLVIGHTDVSGNGNQRSDSATARISAALIAKGYTLVAASLVAGRAATTVVLQRGTTAVLLAQPYHGVAEIEVWGAAQSAVAAVFETLPIELHRLPPRRSALR